MDRWLGRPLPHQLSNPTRAHPCAINLWYPKHAFQIRYAVLASVSGRYPPHKGRLLTRYSPVRHWSEDRSPRHRSTCMCYARRQRSSWARIKLSKICIISLFRALQSFPSFCSSFYFLLEFISLLNCRDSTSHFFLCFVLISLLFNFQWPVCRLLLSFRPAFCGDSNIISYPFRFVKPFSKVFFTFLTFFRSFFFLNPYSSPRPQRLVHYTTFLPLCQGVFKKNWNIFIKCQNLRIYCL